MSNKGMRFFYTPELVKGNYKYRREQTYEKLVSTSIKRARVLRDLW